MGNDKLKYIDRAKGHYRIRKMFTTGKTIEHPAITLGVIRGSHRVFLNNKFIGGGEGLGKLYAYSFDKSLLLNAGNELAIDITSEANLMPALSFPRAHLSSLGYVDKGIRYDDFYYQTLKQNQYSSWLYS